MKEWITELAICTIVATVCTLIWYVLGIDKSWSDAAQTFGSSFLIMFALGLYQRIRKRKE